MEKGGLLPQSNVELNSDDQNKLKELKDTQNEESFRKKPINLLKITSNVSKDYFNLDNNNKIDEPESNYRKKSSKIITNFQDIDLSNNYKTNNYIAQIPIKFDSLNNKNLKFEFTPNSNVRKKNSSKVNNLPIVRQDICRSDEYDKSNEIKKRNSDSSLTVSNKSSFSSNNSELKIDTNDLKINVSNDLCNLNNNMPNEPESNYRKKSSKIISNFKDLDLSNNYKTNNFIAQNTIEFDNLINKKLKIENTPNSNVRKKNSSKVNNLPIINKDNNNNHYIVKTKNKKSKSDSSLTSFNELSNSDKSFSSKNVEVKSITNNFEIKISNYDEQVKRNSPTNSLISSSSSSDNNIPRYSLNTNHLKANNGSFFNADSSRKSNGSKPVLILDKLIARRRSIQMENKQNFTCSNYASKETDSNDYMSNSKIQNCKLGVTDSKGKSLSSTNLLKEKENCLVNIKSDDQLMEKIEKSPNILKMNELKTVTETNKKDSFNSLKFNTPSITNSGKKFNSNDMDENIFKTDAETKNSELNSDKEHTDYIETKNYKCTMIQVQELDEEYRDYNTYLSLNEIKKNSNGSLNLNKNKSSNIKPSVLSKSRSKTRTLNSFDSEKDNECSDNDKIKELEILNTLKSKKSIGSFESFISSKSNSQLNSPNLDVSSYKTNKMIKLDENSNVEILYQSIKNPRKSSIKNKNELNRKKNCFATRKLVFIEDQKDFIENLRSSNYSKSSVLGQIEAKLTPFNQAKNVITSKSLTVDFSNII